jgi:hypothetical protein
VIYDLREQAWLPHCFHLRYDEVSSALRPTFQWTPDGRYIWWQEQIIDMNTSRIQYNLVIADIKTGEYGVIVEDVGFLSGVGIASQVTSE